MTASEAERLADRVLLGVRKQQDRPRAEWHWGIVAKHASNGPRLVREAPEVARVVRMELLRLVLDAPAKDAIEVLEAFDFEYPRGWAVVVDEDDPYAGGPSRDHEQRWAETRTAWELCRAAVGADHEELERLRGAVRDALGGYPAEIVDWYVAQVSAVAEATGRQE